MTLVASELKTVIKDRAKEELKLPDEAIENFGKLTDILVEEIDAYIKTATVTVASGIGVATTGSAAAQAGATNTTGLGSIS